MIYLVNSELYPKEGMFIEEHFYTDENGFEWKIARVENGFFAQYLGVSYFYDRFFNIEVGNKIFKVFNTNNIFFQDASFETFYYFRDILKNGFTDEIWECIHELLEARFMCDSSMLSSEICDGKI